MAHLSESMSRHFSENSASILLA